MLKLKRIKLKKVIEFFKKVPRILGINAFFTFLGLLIIALIFGGLIFYKYSILVEKAEPEISEKPLKFKEKTYQEVSKIWQEKKRRFEEADSKKYPDPFRPILHEKRLSEERTQELLAIPFVQDFLKANNLYEFYKAKGEELLLIEERAQIWQELGLGPAEEYQGTYSQNIRLLEELKKELTK